LGGEIHRRRNSKRRGREEKHHKLLEGETIACFETQQSFKKEYRREKYKEITIGEDTGWNILGK
jgi:hypothetical protein